MPRCYVPVISGFVLIILGSCTGSDDAGVQRECAETRVIPGPDTMKRSTFAPSGVPRSNTGFLSCHGGEQLAAAAAGHDVQEFVHTRVRYHMAGTSVIYCAAMVHGSGPWHPRYGSPHQLGFMLGFELYLYSSFEVGTREPCAFEQSEPGDWYTVLHGYEAYEGPPSWLSLPNESGHCHSTSHSLGTITWAIAAALE